MSRSNPSNSRLPAPRITGAVEMTNSSTFPAANACRMTSAPPPTATSPSPAAGRVVHATADHTRRQRGDELVVELLVGAVHREVVATLVGPRATHHPVVQTLATSAQA